MRSDPAARRQLDALREENGLLRAAFETLEEPSHRLSDKVIADLNLNERDRVARVRRGLMFRRLASAAAFAAALGLCFLLVGPRDPAASVLSGSTAAVVVHGGTHATAKGSHLYDGDELRTGPGQFIRIKLTQGTILDIDENSRLKFEKYVANASLRLDAGRVGIDNSGRDASVNVETQFGIVTAPPQTKSDLWLALNRLPVWPGMLLPQLQSSDANPSAETAGALVLPVLDGSAIFFQTALRFRRSLPELNSSLF